MLEDAATMLEVAGENKFKTRAYHDGADIVRRQTDFIERARTVEELQSIEGIGKALSEKILEYKETGRLPLYEKVMADMPHGLLDMAKLKGLGPNRTGKIWKELGASDLDSLQQMIDNGKLESLKGFGKKTVASIQKNLDYVKKKTGHVLLSTATEEAESLARKLISLDSVELVALSGQVSLARETVDRLDIILQGNHSAIEEKLTASDKWHTENSLIKSKQGKPIKHLHIADKEDFWWTAHEHSMESDFRNAFHDFLRDTGWRFENGRPEKNGKPVSFSSEEEIYDKAGLQYVPRELRVESGTVHFAANGYLPKLVDSSDIRGLVHMHTTWSDGKNTMREMAEAAMARGMTYMLVTDHSQTAAYAGGLKHDRIVAQHEEIEELNQELKGRFRILKGIESDILPDGSLDYPDEVLQLFDAVVGSVHGQFDLSPEAQTDRLVNALRNPYMDILGHSTGRLLLRRPGYEFDMEAVIDTAAEYGKVIEINSNPHRLDLPSKYIKEAKTKGVRFSINPDAHNTLGIFHVEYGVKMARRGWLSPSDVINTFDSSGFLSALRKKQ